MKNGDKVRMSEELKQKLREVGCSEHVDEFGECVGIIQRIRPDWLEVEVRWQPSNLKYAYHPNYLMLV